MYININVNISTKKKYSINSKINSLIFGLGYLVYIKITIISTTNIIFNICLDLYLQVKFSTLSLISVMYFLETHQYSIQTFLILLCSI